jgi:hypothetical protein
MFDILKRLLWVNAEGLILSEEFFNFEPSLHVKRVKSKLCRGIFLTYSGFPSHQES